MPNITAYISTSCDDCRVSLTHITDIKFCRDLLKECEKLGGQKTRITIVKQRIRQLERRPA